MVSQILSADRVAHKKKNLLSCIILVVIATTCLFIVDKRNANDTITLFSNIATRKAKETGSSQSLTWLLAYPFAGSVVTTKIVQEVSGKSVATNYGDAMWNDQGQMAIKAHDSVPVFKDRPTGPYKMHTKLELPKTDLLTKTFCGGHCIDEGTKACTLSNYAPYLNNADLFLNACSSGTKYQKDGNVFEVTHYDPHRVKKAVVMLRNPIEILVARFADHYRFRKTFTMDKAGFSEWCASDDAQGGSQNLAKNWYLLDMQYLAKSTPCHAEFYRIVQWYNQVFKMIDKLGLELLMLYFEDYDKNAEDVVDNIFNFINLSKKEIYTIPFSRPHGEAYKWDKWFTSDEMVHIKKFFNTVANLKTEQEFARYWPEGQFED